MPAQLVAIHQKATKQLAAAQSRLLELMAGMDKTPPGQRATFIQELKENLRQYAERELSWIVQFNK